MELSCYRGRALGIRLSLVQTLATGVERLSLRGKGRLLDTLCPRAGLATRTLFGRTVRLDLSDHIQRWMFLGLYECGPTRLVREYLKPGMVVVDVGANVGYYTLLALSRVGERGHVIAIEPAPRPRQRLVAAVRGVPNVTILASALGSERSTGTLYLDRETDNDTPTMVPHHGGVPRDVTTIRLDECLAELRFDHIDLLKLDVEGWEPQILAGASSLLAAGRIGAMLCELNDYWLRAVGTNAAAFHQQILDYGFRDITPGALTRFETRLFVHEKAPEKDGGIPTSTRALFTEQI